MFDGSIISVQNFLAQYGLPAVFFLGFFEEILFFLPSTAFFIALGFFGIDSYVTVGEAAFTAFGKLGSVVSLGILMGGWIMYGIAYVGGKPAIEKIGHFMRVRWSDIERFAHWFERGHIDDAALLGFRIIPTFPIGITSLFCGLIRIPLGQFTWTTVVGSIPRVGGLAFLGWYAGREYEQYAEKISGVESYALILFIVVVAACVWYFHSFRRNR